MSEGNIYLSSWSLKDGKYVLYAQDNPKKVIVHENIDTAKELLAESIHEWTEDGEAIVELVPAIKQQKKFGLSGYLTFGYNESVYPVEKKATNVYFDERCKNCGLGIGKRNSKTLELERLPKDNVVGITGLYPNTTIYRKDFIEPILKESDCVYDLSEVYFDEKSTNYVEVFSDELVSKVGFADSEYFTSFQQSWNCSTCGRKSFSFSNNAYKNVSLYLPLKQLEKLPKVFFADALIGGLSVCVRDDIWESAVSTKKKKALSEGCVLLKEEFVEMPELPEADNLDWVE